MEAREASPGPFASPELKAAMHERTQAVHALHDAEAAISIAQIRRMDGRLALKRAEQGIPDPPPAVVIGGPGVMNGKPADWEKPGHKPTELGRFTLVEPPIEVDPMVRAEVAPGDFRRLTESVARRLGLL